MEAHFIGFNLWVKAVEKAKSTDVEAVLAALPGLETPNLTGGIARMLPNHHITKPVYIGEVRADGQFDIVWQTKGTVPGDAWSDHLPGSKDIEADWVKLKCGNYNSKTKACSGQNYK
jgi:urea transport system substrate-binding protein